MHNNERTASAQQSKMNARRRSQHLRRRKITVTILVVDDLLSPLARYSLAVGEMKFVTMRTKAITADFNATATVKSRNIYCVYDDIAQRQNINKTKWKIVDSLEI